MSGRFTAAVLAVALLGPGLIAAGLGDSARVFAVTWFVAALPAAAGALVGWRARQGTGRDAVERALTVVVPIVVVLLVGSPWILSVFGLRVRDTGVGSLFLLALAAVPYAVVATAARVAAVRGRSPAALVPVVVAGAVAGGLAWLTTPVVGIVGAAFGWLLGWSAAAAWVTMSVTRSVHRRNRTGAASLIDTGR